MNLSSLILLSFITLLFLDNVVTYEDRRERSDSVTENGTFVYAVWIIAAVWALLLSKDMISSFIYFAF